MTVRPWNVSASGAADVAAVVIILKKTQGSVWSESGRTPLCPTIGWLRDTYGAGQYELRLKLGNRIVCMANADCTALAASAAPSAGAVSAVAAGGQPAAAARHARPLARTALGAW